MTSRRKAYFVGGGIGSLAGAAFLIRDGGMPGSQISILETGSLLGGSLDAAGDADRGYSMRGGRMLTTDNYECTWDLFKSIPSLTQPGRSVFEETVEFNEKHVSHAMARLVDRRRAKVPVASMGFSMHDRAELLKLLNAEESSLGDSCITDHLSPAFFETPFWFMWVTTFAFQPWHSAVELRRYLHRFMLEFSRIETLAGVKRTVFNQYDSMVVPLQRWLQAQGVRLVTDCTVTDLDHKTEDGLFEAIALHCTLKGRPEILQLEDGDLVFVQNGSMTDASSLGSMTAAPPKLKKAHNGSWTLWEKLAEGRPAFGKPAVFNSCVAQSDWASFTVTLKDPGFFDRMRRFSGNEAGTGGLVTFKDSNWLMSIVLAHQPHFANQPADVQIFWGYGLFPDRIGNFVAKAMADCTGAELLQELCGHLRFDLETVDTAHCIPCRMPYITSMFMPRAPGDRPLPVPPGTKNFAFIGQFVEIPLDTVFTVEFSVRAAQMAVYELLHITKPIPPVTPHDASLHAKFDALVKAMR
ncbi:oleate hydratase [Variovorax sp. PAMC 28711]|uniref:oleate hydratase n=1 Tax=Variovorax sp. PAMC 28711 TaxID=1795631 RepID=UPI00078DD3E9|nr:oleate hydratase [Variovorax sp. PAMC 28711]AMM23543.1 oleate hydratase [Variovorax sp. PAMC 28711]